MLYNHGLISNEILYMNLNTSLHVATYYWRGEAIILSFKYSLPRQDAIELVAARFIFLFSQKCSRYNTGENCILMAQYSMLLWDPVNTVMELWLPQMVRNFLTTERTIIVLEKTLFHNVGYY
jgi:hypothetical protein